MHVRVVQPRKYCLSLAIDAFRIAAGCQNFFVGSHHLDHAVFLQNCFGKYVAFHINLTVV